MVFFDFQNVFFYLEQVGFTEPFLPFLLIFALLHAVMAQVGLLENNKIRGIIAFTISLLVVIPHVLGTYPPGLDAIDIINNILPGAFLVIMVVFIFLILLGFLTPKTSIKDSPIFSIAAALAVFGLLYVIISALDPRLLPQWLYFLILDPFWQTLLILGLMFFAVIYFIALRPEKQPKSVIERSHEFLKKLFGET